MTIPSFLLAKLYVKGSLRNTEGGFEFQLKNIIDSTSLSGVGPVLAGGRSYEAGAIIAVAGDRSRPCAGISAADPVPFPVNGPIRVVVAGERLPTGSCSVTVHAASVDIGAVKFGFSDQVG